jgi:hypothetical protein
VRTDSPEPPSQCRKPDVALEGQHIRQVEADQPGLRPPVRLRVLRRSGFSGGQKLKQQYQRFTLGRVLSIDRAGGVLKKIAAFEPRALVCVALAAALLAI